MEDRMSNRREFLKSAAVGAVVLGAQGTLAASAETQGVGKSKVVVAQDAALHSAEGVLNEKRVISLLDRSIREYSGIEHPTAAWKKLVPVGKTIGIKVNGLGGRGISSHAALVFAICERLQQAGVKPGNIIVWDRNTRDLEACGLTINTDPAKIRVFGSDTSGYVQEKVAFGSANVRLSKILAEQCDFVIGVPILKDHAMAGVTFAMKNMYGVIERPNELHGGNCNPGVADLNCVPAIRNKVRLTIGDAMSSVYNGGPTFKPQFLWYPNSLIVGEDRVAVDHTAWQILDRKRVEVGIGKLEASNRLPRYIATAADASHGLGVDDPSHIHLLNVHV